MPALALTDLRGNVFGLVKFYRRRASRGVKPIVLVATSGSPRVRARRAVPAGAALRRSRRLPASCASGCRVLHSVQPAPGPCGTVGDRLVFAEPRRPDRALRRAGRRRRSGAAAGQRVCGAQKHRARVVLALSGVYLEVQARLAAGRRSARRGRPWTSQARPACPSSPRIRLQYLRREDFRAHEARVVHRRRSPARRPERPRPFTTEQHLATTTEMAAKFADIPEALANTVTVAKRCNLAIALGKPHLPDFPLPRASRSTSTSASSRARALPSPRRALPGPRGARAAAARSYRVPAEFEAEDHRAGWASPATS